MARVRRASYFVEQFTYFGTYRNLADPGGLDVRYRPLIMVALLDNGELPWLSISTPDPPRNNMGKSLSMLGNISSRDDNRGNDYFLPLYDHGHLMADSLGGCRESFNFIPQLRALNRGGDWRGLETVALCTNKPAVYVIKCVYDAADDPRLPVAVGGALIPISKDTADTLSADWTQSAAKIRTQVANATPFEIGLKVADELKIDRTKIVRATFRQRPFETVQPYFRPSADFLGDLVAAQGAISGGWRVETDQLAHNLTKAPDLLLEGYVFTERYRLPPAGSRPYAVLDYMSLRGKLNGALIGGSDAHVDIANEWLRQTTEFNAEMRALAMHVNLYNNRNRMSNQYAYLSDAFDHYIADPGTAGQGIVMDPEFDHIVPVTPTAGKRGPTIFSNLQIVSPRYNSQKGNAIYHLDQDVVDVGSIEEARTRSQRSKLTHRLDPESDDEDAPKSRHNLFSEKEHVLKKKKV